MQVVKLTIFIHTSLWCKVWKQCSKTIPTFLKRPWVLDHWELLTGKLKISFCWSVKMDFYWIFKIFFCSRTQLQSEEIVADLVHCFLLPEVQKTTMREKGTAFISFFVHSKSVKKNVLLFNRFMKYENLHIYWY